MIQHILNASSTFPGYPLQLKHFLLIEMNGLLSFVLPAVVASWIGAPPPRLSLVTGERDPTEGGETRSREFMC